MVDKVMNTRPNDGRAPLMAHLRELRNRIMYSAIALGVGLLVGMFFGSPIIRLLQKPGGDMGLITTKVMEPMAVYFQVSMLTAVVIAMPFLVFQLMAFVAPGLTTKEKRVVFAILPGIIFMFLCGVAFAYFVALHPALTFLYRFNSSIATAMPTLILLLELGILLSRLVYKKKRVWVPDTE
jgi:sec-independent protein translocase protein TatC